jgi:hypothetical protein
MVVVDRMSRGMTCCPGTTLLGLNGSMGPVPKAAAWTPQPLALGRNPVGIDRAARRSFIPVGYYQRVPCARAEVMGELTRLFC